MRTVYFDIDDKTKDLRQKTNKNKELARQFRERFELSWIFHENALEGLILDAPSLEMAIRRRLERMAEALLDRPAELSRLERLNHAVALLDSLPFDANKRKIQNTYHQIFLKVFPAVRARAAQGDEGVKAWVHQFHELGERLLIRLDQ